METLKELVVAGAVAVGLYLLLKITFGASYLLAVIAGVCAGIVTRLLFDE